MASEIRVDTLKTTSGLGTVSFGNNGVILSGIVTATSVDTTLVTTESISVESSVNTISVNATSINTKSLSVESSVTANSINVGVAVTINSGIITATNFVKSGGTSSQYLRANGSSEELSVTYGINAGVYTYVYPPSGFTIANLIGFIPSVREFYYSGTVDYNDSSYCYYSIEPENNRILVTCYTSEQRYTPANNWHAIWRKTV